MEILADILIVLGVLGITPLIMLLPTENAPSMESLSVLAGGAAGSLTMGVLIHKRRTKRAE